MKRPSRLTRLRNKLAGTLLLLRRIPRFLWSGFRFYPPNYVYKPVRKHNGTVVDVGCGHVAEFSRMVIERYGVRAVGVDPTRKHASHLEQLVSETDRRFQYLPVAVGAEAGTLTFNESEENESGSLLGDHTNVKHDHIRSYEVEVITLRELPVRVGADRIDILKLDLEGAEYDLLPRLTVSDCSAYGQIICEFHHHCVDRYTREDTRQCAEAMRALGMKAFSLDDHNFLFYWPDGDKTRVTVPGTEGPS